MKVLHSNPSRLNRCLMTGGVLFVIWAHHAPAQERAILTTVATHTIVSGSANTAELGDVVHGRIDRPGDFDVYLVTVAEGTALDLEVEARSIGSLLDATLSLSDENGTRLAHKIDCDGLGGRIRFTVPSSGRYFIAVRGFGGSGGPQHTYRLTIGTTEPAPADRTIRKKMPTCPKCIGLEGFSLSRRQVTGGSEVWHGFRD